MASNVLQLPQIHTVALDFDGVFTDNKVWVSQDGHELVRCDRGDGLAFDWVRTLQRSGRLHAEFFILSTEVNPVVLARADKLQLACHQGVGNKLSFIRAYLRERFPDEPAPERGLAFIGNDLNDLALMRVAGFSAAPADAHPRVREVADLVLAESGGEGCVRAFIEHLLGIAHFSVEELDDLISGR